MILVVQKQLRVVRIKMEWRCTLREHKQSNRRQTGWGRQSWLTEWHRLPTPKFQRRVWGGQAGAAHQTQT